MQELSKEQILAVKGRGFLRNRGTDLFSGRVVVAGGIYTHRDLCRIAECARLYGSGLVGATSRQAMEIVGIPYDKIEEAEAFLAEGGLAFGGTGARVRPITACKGTTCVFGNIDTRGMAKMLHERFYLGMRAVTLPHKLKIGVGGCPNSCIKPSLNDIGIEGRRRDGKPACRITVGGTWGKIRRDGTLLPRDFTPEEIGDAVEKILLWYRENGYEKERLGALVDRVGVEALLSAMEGDGLLRRREEILAAPIRPRPAK